MQWLWGHHKPFSASVYNVRSSAHCRRKLFWCRRWTISPLLVRRHSAVAWQPPERYDKLPLKLGHGWVITSPRLMSMQLRNPVPIPILAQIMFVSKRGLWGRSPAEQLQNGIEKVLTKMLLRCLATTPVSWFRTRMLPVCQFVHLHFIWWQVDSMIQNLKFKRKDGDLDTTRNVICSVNDDVIKWKHIPRHWTFVRGIHRWPVNSTYKCK